MIFTTLLIIAIFEGIVLGIIILKSPLFKTKANNYLAYAIFIMSLLLLNLVFEITEAYGTVPFLHFIDNIEWVLIFPVFIFLFIVNQVNHPVKHSKNIRWLFLPFLCSAVINIFNDLDKVAAIYEIPYAVNIVIEALIDRQIYLVQSFIICILLYAYTFIKFSKSQQEKKWITFLWVLVFTLLFSWVILVVAVLLFHYDGSSIVKLIALFGTFLIHWTSYFGIFKYRLARDKEGIRALLNNRMPVNDDSKVTIDDVKQETNLNTLHSYSEENSNFKKLENLCENHKIYRDSTLDREKVAKKLGISAGYLSQLVNTITGENFTTYINRYRVEDVKEMISDTEFKNYSLLSIGLESGFPSKTTFYKAFKKLAGMTPNSYRKAQK